jgi:hypothetical protein
MFTSRNYPGNVGHVGDLGIHGKIILKLILKIWCEDFDWIYLAQDWV